MAALNNHLFYVLSSEDLEIEGRGSACLARALPVLGNAPAAKDELVQGDRKYQVHGVTRHVEPTEEAVELYALLLRPRARLSSNAFLASPGIAGHPHEIWGAMMLLDLPRPLPFPIKVLHAGERWPGVLTGMARYGASPPTIQIHAWLQSEPDEEVAVEEVEIRFDGKLLGKVFSPTVRPREVVEPVLEETREDLAPSRLPSVDREVAVGQVEAQRG
jgi:hypothetical protein